MNSRDRLPTRYERKREIILEAAARLFTAQGLGGTTLADVAQSVDLTTTSITYYFRRKEELIAACIERTLSAIEGLLSEAGSASTPRGRLELFIRLYFDLQARIATGEHQAYINVWDVRVFSFNGADASGIALARLLRRMRRSFIESSAGRLSHADISARTLFVFSTFAWAVEWLKRFDPDEFGRCAAVVSDLLVAGFASGERDWSVEAVDVPLEAMRRNEVSRDAFLRAATQLINEQGYRGASVDRISAKLHVTKGSFYHHNATKEELVAECFDRSFAVIRAVHRAAPQGSGSGWERLCRIAASLVAYQCSDRGPLLRYHALAAMPDHLRPKLATEFGRLTQRTAGVIVDGIVDGSIRPLDPVIAAEIVGGMIDAAAELGRWQRGRSVDALIGHYVRPSLTGLFTSAR